jgi:hypothetical protein
MRPERIHAALLIPQLTLRKPLEKLGLQRVLGFPLLPSGSLNPRGTRVKVTLSDPLRELLQIPDCCLCIDVPGPDGALQRHLDSRQAHELLQEFSAPRALEESQSPNGALGRKPQRYRSLWVFKFYKQDPFREALVRFEAPPERWRLGMPLQVHVHFNDWPQLGASVAVCLSGLRLSCKRQKATKRPK